MIRAGTIIVCPKCKDYLFVVSENFHGHEIEIKFMILGDSIPEPAPGKPFVCPKCSAYLTRCLITDPKEMKSSLDIFTDEGWLQTITERG